MVQAIVYESNTGFTAEYANMLAEAVSLPAYARTEAFEKLARGAEVAFLGWVKAGSIQGLASVKRRYTVRVLAAVGMAPAESDMAEGICRRYAAFAPVYYLPGGFHMARLSGGSRAAMKVMAAVAGRLAKKPGDSARKAAEMAVLLQNGGTSVDRAYLETMIRYIREQ